MIVDDIIAAIAIVVIVGLAIGYIVKEKRRGAKCIGCPHAGSCGKNCSCGTKSQDTEK